MNVVAYQGERGAFGDEACRLFLPDWERLAVPTFAAVAEAVIDGRSDRGMIPLVNSLAGPVPGNAEIVAASGLDVIAEPELPVRMHLMARPGIAIGDIRVLTSHPMALKQCTRLIAELGLRTVEASNTAIAAMDVARGNAADVGVVGSEAAAEFYGLHILRRDVHDRPDNMTRFAVLARP